jgi:hypothetical protein
MDPVYVITKSNVDGIGNVMKGFISAFSVHTNSKIECNPSYMYGRYDTVLDSPHIYGEGDTKQSREDFYTCRLLLLRSEESDQQHIYNEFQYTNGCGNQRLNEKHGFSMSRLIDWNYDTSRLCEAVKSRILGTISRIKFLPVITDAVETILKQSLPGKSLGVAVRTWKGAHEKGIDRPYNSETYRKAIVSAMLQMPQITTVYLSVDNETVLAEYCQFLSQLGLKVVYLGRDESWNAIQHAFINMLVLSRCDCLVGNRISTYTELSYWFSGLKLQVIPVF